LNGSQPAPLRFVLDGVLNIRTIETVHRRVLEALAEHASVQIDCTDAETADLSVIQLLLSARHSARRDGKHLTLLAPAGGALAVALEQGGFLPSGDAGHSGADPFWSGAP
jgi:anti-anti-sigma regulatory factor